MDFDFPALMTGLVTPLPPEQRIWKDAATHVLSNPLGNYRLRSADDLAMQELTKVETGDIPVLLLGRYVLLENIFISVDKLARIDIISLHDNGSTKSGRAWRLVPILESDPGDGWPFKIDPGDHWPF